MSDGEHGCEAQLDVEPTPGERLLYGLGLLYRRWAASLPDAIPPHRIDVEALARSLGVWSEVEFVQVDEDDPELQYFHLPGEVLVIDHRVEFPWQLLSTSEWGQGQEQKEFWRFFH